MSPEDFRRYGHELIDWLADYHEGMADRPVMAKTQAGRNPRRPSLRAAKRAGRFRRGDRGSEPHRRSGPVALAASAFLRLFPRQRAPLGHPRRPRKHRARGDRTLLAIEPGGDRNRGSRHRLAAADARTLAGLQRRDPGHRLDQHAGRARLRARASDELCAGAWRTAGRNAHATRLRVGARPQLRRQGRASRRLWARQPASRPVRRPIRNARRHPCRNDRRGSQERRPAVRNRGDCRHDGDDGDRSDCADRARSRGATGSGCMSTPRWRAAR